MTFPFGKIEIDAVEYGSMGNAILGIRDSGKTYTATYIAERLFEAGIPFIAFDPIGVWRFLKVPGEGEGYPVVVAGGMHGDLPLTKDNAKALVRAAMESGVSLIIDLYSMELSKADWRRIVKDCAQVLLFENSQHGLRHVFIEEAAEFVPQVIREHGDVYAAIEKLVRMGGNARIGVTLINQRAEEVNKAVLELCDNLFLHRQKGRNSLNALNKWLSLAGSSKSTAIIGSLPTLPQGECWGWLHGTTNPVRTKVPVKHSFHPDRRAMRGSDEATPRTAVDVGEFVARMQQQLEEDVPLTEAARNLNFPQPILAVVHQADGLAAAEKRGRDLGYIDGYNTAIEHGNSRRASDLQVVSEMLNALSARVDHMLRDVPLLQLQSGSPPPASAGVPLPVASAAVPQKQPVARVSGGGAPSSAIKMLAVLDTNPPVWRSWAQVATLAGLKARGGHYNSGRKWLLDRGAVQVQGDLIRIDVPTAGAEPPVTDTRALVEMWEQSLDGAAPRILRDIYNVGGQARKQNIAERIGLKPLGGHWNSAWKQLRDNGIIAESGDTVTLTELFHPASRAA